MKSGWFWQTVKWEVYQRAYYADRSRVEEYKSSPLCDDHEFDWELNRTLFNLSTHQSQVVDLTLPKPDLWRGIRKSYRPLINKALRDYAFKSVSVSDYHALHSMANERETRGQATWDCMDEWMRDGHGGTIGAYHGELLIAGAYFIIYQGAAYYASGASITDNVQHAVIWTAMKRLKDAGVGLLELGQIDGETEKERNIGKFKSGFGGKAMPFTVATRRSDAR